MRLLTVLDVLSSTPARAKQLAPRRDGPLTHFASPRGETCRLGCRLSNDKMRSRTWCPDLITLPPFECRVIAVTLTRVWASRLARVTAKSAHSLLSGSRMILRRVGRRVWSRRCNVLSAL